MADELREAFPLSWPSDQVRTPTTERDGGWQFKVTFGRALQELLHELKLMRATDVVVSTNIPLRRDGLPYADDREPKDPGVAVYFTRSKRQLVIACDSYSKVRANLRAVGLTIASLRNIERYGSTSLLERAFTGFAALPPKGGGEKPWWDVLGVSRDAAFADVKAEYRRLAAQHHPDAGGDAETMARINRAWTEAERELAK